MVGDQPIVLSPALWRVELAQVVVLALDSDDGEIFGLDSSAGGSCVAWRSRSKSSTRYYVSKDLSRTADHRQVFLTPGFGEIYGLVGVTGFEPATSWSRTKRSSQAEPHPDWLGALPPHNLPSYRTPGFGQRR